MKLKPVGGLHILIVIKKKYIDFEVNFTVLKADSHFLFIYFFFSPSLKMQILFMISQKSETWIFITAIVSPGL